MSDVNSLVKTLDAIITDALRMRAFRKAVTGNGNDAWIDHFKAELIKLVDGDSESSEEQFNQALDDTMEKFKS